MQNTPERQWFRAAQKNGMKIMEMCDRQNGIHVVAPGNCD